MELVLAWEGGEGGGLVRRGDRGMGSAGWDGRRVGIWGREGSVNWAGGGGGREYRIGGWELLGRGGTVGGGEGGDGWGSGEEWWEFWVGRRQGDFGWGLGRRGRSEDWEWEGVSWPGDGVLGAF
ncbi:hypothetical protein Tco_1546960 [Tanacetum coccineum]